MKKKISVIMSTCNTKNEYLKLAVDSILNQTYGNIELIVIVDGGKYDDCLAEIEDERLFVVKHRKSLGLATRLNEAISLSTGDYIARMDSDDYALPFRLEQELEFMERKKDVDICGMFAKDFGERKTVQLCPSVDCEYINAELFFSNVLIHPTIMFRREYVVKESLKYNESFQCSQDYELWSRLIGNCTFAVIPKIGLFYRRHKSQASSNKKLLQKEYYYKVIAENLKKLGMTDADLKYVKMLNCHLPIENVDGLRDFIERCLAQNAYRKIYNKKSIRRVIYRRFLISLIKEKKYLLGCKYFNWYDCIYWLKKRKMMLKCRFCLLKYNDIYRCLNNRCGGVK